MRHLSLIKSQQLFVACKVYGSSMLMRKGSINATFIIIQVMQHRVDRSLCYTSQNSCFLYHALKNVNVQLNDMQDHVYCINFFFSDMGEIVLNKCVTTEGNETDLEYTVSFDCSLLEDPAIANRFSSSLPCASFCQECSCADKKHMKPKQHYFEKTKSPLYKLV